MSQDLGPIEVRRKIGTEPFYQGSKALDFDLLSFWQWSASDLVSNTTRGILAEYLVARALGDANGARAEWAPFDAVTPSNIRVEVKSAAYIQSWHQDRPSRITFDTRPTFAWDAATNLLEQERRRQADVYVFCLLGHRDHGTVDPLNVSEWRFFVLSTARLNAALGEQKSVGLRRLQQIGAEESDYSGLARAVERAGGKLAHSSRRSDT